MERNREKPEYREEEWDNYTVKHYRGAAGELDEYYAKDTGKLEKMVVRDSSGTMETWKIDPKTGATEHIAYDEKGAIKLFDDERALREALKNNPITRAVISEEVERKKFLYRPSIPRDKIERRLIAEIVQKFLEMPEKKH